LHYEHKEYGYNYRMSNVLAAIGVAQMEVLNSRIQKRREIFEYYKQKLSDIKEINFMPEIEKSKGNRWLSALTFKNLWKSMHLQPLFKNSLKEVDGTSKKLFEQGICLPSGSSMRENDLLRVVYAIRKALK